MAKGVSKLRALYETVEDRGDAAKDEFFKLVVFLIQLPLTRFALC